MQVRSILCVAALGLTGCASWQKFDGYLPTVPSTAVVEGVRVLGYARRFSVLELHRVDEFVANGSLGAKTDLFSTVTLRVDESGMTNQSIRQTWGHSANGLVRGIANINETSLCGIQPLSRDLSARTVTREVSISSSRDVERSVLERLVVDSISGDWASICSPKPNFAYEFQLSRQAQLRWSAAQNLRWPLAARVNCRAADSKVPARNWVPSLADEALEVRCTASYEKEGAYVSRYAFFYALGIYLPLEVSEPERGSTVYRYIKAVLKQES